MFSTLKNIFLAVHHFCSFICLGLHKIFQCKENIPYQFNILNFNVYIQTKFSSCTGQVYLPI